MNAKTCTRLVTATLLTLGLGSAPAMAQVKMDRNNLNVFVKTGIGYLQTHKFNKQDYNNAPEDYKGNTPFVAVGLDLGIAKNLSVGLVAGYSTFHSSRAIPSSKDSYDGDIKAYNLFATVKYYLPMTFGKISPYVHADLIGLTAYSKRRYVISPSASPYLIDPSIDITENYGLYAGANYQLSPKFSALAEVGYGYTLLNVGINCVIKD